MRIHNDGVDSYYMWQFTFVMLFDDEDRDSMVIPLRYKNLRREAKYGKQDKMFEFPTHKNIPT